MEGKINSLARGFKIPELLSPAGDTERFYNAVDFGADAVYLAGNSFGMRAAPSNFNFEQLKKAVDYAHSKDVKIYLACNVLARNDEIAVLPEFLKNAQACGIDALIVSDLGVFDVAKQAVPDVDIHISTQLGVVNYLTAQRLYNMGAKRVVLARELSLSEIAEIRAKTSSELELEAFVHGSMCVSYSGRCLLSNYMTGRDSNRGDCAQPCRWQYALMEKKREGMYFPISEDETGTYILNANDLCMIDYIPQLVSAGVDCFKIEGRAKSAYYTAISTYAYRMAIDGFAENPSMDYRPEQWILDEVRKISHRKYSTGFFFGTPECEQTYDNGGYIREWDVVALAERQENGRLYINQRNKFYDLDVLEVVEPGKKPFEIKVMDLRDKDGNCVESAPNPMSDFSFACDMSVGKGALIRKEK